jgi:CHAT domain-containing protein
VDLLASKQDFAPATADQQQVASLIQELDKQEEEARVPAASTEQSGKRSARNLEVKTKLRTVAPELASLVVVAQMAIGAVQALLSPDETLIEYYYNGDDLYAFVVTRDAVKAVKLNGVNLVTEVGQFRAALEDRRTGRFKEISQKLYARLIRPIESLVTTRQLLIVSHGALHYLPFSALQSDADYLIDRYSIRHLPSASVMQFLKDRQTAKMAGVLAFGNPDLGNPQYDLKFAQDEAVAIAKGFPQAKVLVRKDATKTALKTLGGQFPYLHFATHGKFDPDAPLNSGLLLASDAQNDGFLSLGELYSMRLNADLVTLSACETGLGKISNGDDVVGLARGFLYAGSNAIVASLWEVDDQATSYLMTEFYANLKKGNKREALRQSQLAAKKQYQHPFYWAAFQLTGRAE